MKEELEGSYIPVKNYDFVLPDGFKPEEPQQFTTTLPTKKSDKPVVPVKIMSTSIQISKSEAMEDDSSIFPKEFQESSKVIPKTTILKPTQKSVGARPATAHYKVPKYLKPDPGKTIKEIDNEKRQKEGAQEFVAGWLEQADKKRESTLKALESKPANHFDNKLTSEINELMKKLQNTRRTTASSINNMKKALKTENFEVEDRLRFKSNPFKSGIIMKRDNPIEVQSLGKLDLHKLYNSGGSTHSWLPLSAQAKKEAEEALISDDEKYVNSIEFEDI